MFSHTVEYALRAMMYLASLDGAPVASERIAANTHVPAGYLSKVLRDLVLGNLVTSFRGPRGGFVLAAKPNDITIRDVINAVEPIHRTQIRTADDAGRTQSRPLQQRLDDALAGIELSFCRTTLAQMLAGGSDERERSVLPDATVGKKPPPQKPRLRGR